MEKNIENKIETHEEMISAVALKHFGEKPKFVTRITTGICNEVYNTTLADKEIIVRLSPVDYFLKGSHYHIPILKELGLEVPEILAEDYSKADIPYSYQFLSKLKGVDIGQVMESLTDKQLRLIAKEISFAFDRTKTLPTNGKFGVVWGDFTEFSDSWTERMKIWIEETIQQGTKTGTIDENLKSILKNLQNKYQDYFDKVKPVTYLSDICSKNVMVDDGVFAGFVDLDGLTQGDPLEAIGRIKASWPGTYQGDVYTNAIMDEQNLNSQQKEMVLVYALLNRIAWSSENGIQFNQNTSSVVDVERATQNKKAIHNLLVEYEKIQ
ncbi:MAG: phosphotransferase [Leadbetterella sp.]|nr:phosphotransferase [Leadbetterella sp.]